MGIRYKTPVGPVRFDLGYALNPTRYPIQETGQTESLRRINVLFQYWTNFLMKRILHIHDVALCAVAD